MYSATCNMNSLSSVGKGVLFTLVPNDDLLWGLYRP